MYLLAAMYDLRYTKSNTDIEDNSKWDSLTSLNQDDLIEGTLDPVEGGNPVQLKLNPQLFDADIDYFMAMKATDERNTVSAKSNVATITRLVPPGQVADLTSEVTTSGDGVSLFFTAPGDDGMVGKGTYILKYVLSNPFLDKIKMNINLFSCYV